MIRNVCVSITLMLLIASRAFGQQPAPSADDIAHRVVDKLAPAGAADKARYISFTLNVERNGQVIASYPQRWDRFTGEYRVSGRTNDGLSFDVTLNVNTKKGHGTINGVAVTDNAKFQELFAIGARRFANDTNLLMMPFKLLYPGVHRANDGRRADSSGHTWDLLKLTFDAAVDLPTGDTYWMWVNRETSLIDEWDFRPLGMKPEERPLESLLQSYNRVGGMLVSTRREIRGNRQVIRFDDLKILADVPAGAFQ